MTVSSIPSSLLATRVRGACFTKTRYIQGGPKTRLFLRVFQKTTADDDEYLLRVKNCVKSSHFCQIQQISRVVKIYANKAKNT